MKKFKVYLENHSVEDSSIYGFVIKKEDFDKNRNMTWDGFTSYIRSYPPLINDERNINLPIKVKRNLELLSSINPNVRVLYIDHDAEKVFAYIELGSYEDITTSKIITKMGYKALNKEGLTKFVPTGIAMDWVYLWNNRYKSVLNNSTVFPAKSDDQMKEISRDFSTSLKLKHLWNDDVKKKMSHLDMSTKFGMFDDDQE